MDAVRQNLLEIRSSLAIIESAEIPRAPGLRLMDELLGDLQKALRSAESPDRERLSRLGGSLKTCRDVAGSQVMSFEENLGNLRQLAQTISRGDPDVEKARSELTQAIALMESCRSRLVSSAPGTAPSALTELKATCQKVRTAQRELINGLEKTVGTVIRDEVLEAIGSCRPVALTSLTPEELMALRDSRLREFLSITLSSADR